MKEESFSQNCYIKSKIVIYYENNLVIISKLVDFFFDFCFKVHVKLVHVVIFINNKYPMKINIMRERERERERES